MEKRTNAHHELSITHLCVSYIQRPSWQNLSDLKENSCSNFIINHHIFVYPILRNKDTCPFCLYYIKMFCRTGTKLSFPA